MFFRLKKLQKIKGLFTNTFLFFLKHPLWKENKLLPISHFLKLQLKFFLGKKKLYLKWFKNVTLVIEKGDHGLTGNYYVGLHEIVEMGFAIHLLRKKDIFIDVGANCGSYTLLASAVCGAKSISFEPVEKTFEKLNQNVNFNRIQKKVDLRKKVLVSNTFLEKNKKILFSVDNNCRNQVVNLSYSGEKNLLECSTLDLECKNIKPTLIKIDVEGFEINVLTGSLNILNRESLIALIIEGHSKKIGDLLRSKGFTDVNYCPFKRKIRHQNDLERLDIHRNWIWIRSSKFELVKQRVKNASIRKIYGRYI